MPFQETSPPFGYCGLHGLSTPHSGQKPALHWPCARTCRGINLLCLTQAPVRLTWRYPEDRKTPHAPGQACVNTGHGFADRNPHKFGLDATILRWLRYGLVDLVVIMTCAQFLCDHKKALARQEPAQFVSRLFAPAALCLITTGDPRLQFWCKAGRLAAIRNPALIMTSIRSC